MLGTKPYNIYILGGAIKGTEDSDGAGRVNGISLAADIIVDQNPPSSVDDDKSAPVVTMMPKTNAICLVENEAGESVKLYADSMSYNMTVIDPGYNYTDENGEAQTAYSGLDEVTWTIKDSKNLSASGGKTKLSGKQKEQFSVPVDVGSKYENNDIVITVTAKDKVGNTTTYVQKLAVDNYDPRVTASYSNNSVMNKKYFKSDRVLKVNVEDLNFDTSKTSMVSEISASGWSKSGTNKYSAIIKYNKDGDYTFKMSTSDKAGNAAKVNDSIWASGTTAAWAFTVDKTASVINNE